MSKTVRAPGTLAATGLSPCTLSWEPLTLWVTCTGRPLGACACREGPSCQHFRPDAQLPLLTLTQERRTLPEPDGRRIDPGGPCFEIPGSCFLFEEGRVEGSLYMWTQLITVATALG